MRQRMLRSLLVLPVVALAFALVACGGDGTDVGSIGDGHTPPPDSPVDSSIEPAPDATPGEEEAEFVEPRPGMDEVRPISWDHAEVETETTVVVEWWSGVRPCHVLDRIEVDYGADAITITLFEGHEPWDEPRYCIEIAKRKATIVELDEPVDGREIVDGARA